MWCLCSFNMLSKFVIAFLQWRKCLLISWLQSLSTVILEPMKIKSITVSIVSPSIWHEVMRPDAMILVFESWALSQLLLNHHHNPEKFPDAPWQSMPPSWSIGNHWSAFFHSSFHFLEWYVNEMMGLDAMIFIFRMLSFKPVFFTLLAHLHQEAL